VCSPAEVLAAFRIGTALTWFELARYNMHTATEDTTMKDGKYPRDCIPPFLIAYFKDVIKTSKDVVHDDRIAQPLYALMSMTGDASNDGALIEDGVHASLKLTNEKVTELTPYPIPEVLAVYLESHGKQDQALKWYEKALDGIKLCVMRTKTDAIVYRACELQAKTSPQKALQWAFSFSPKFVPSQDLVQVKPGRELLVKACEGWAKKLGYADLQAAKDKLMKGDLH